MARASPRVDPRTNPIAALRSVNRAAPAAARAVVAPTASRARNSAAMSHVCGSLMSVANGEGRSGGRWSMAIPVRRTSRSASGSPPIHLSSSQTTSDGPAGRRGTRRRLEPGDGSTAPTGARPPTRGPVARRPRRPPALPATAWSAMSRAASMISKPSASCVLGDAQGRVRVDRVVDDHRVQAMVAEVLADGFHLVRRAVVRRDRVTGRGSGRDQGSRTGRGSDGHRSTGASRPAVRGARAWRAPMRAALLDEAILLVDPDGRERGGQ